MVVNSPRVVPIMLQRWHEIAFFHWSCEPSVVQKRLPPKLSVDTIDGKAWISLTPFLLSGLRLPHCPRALGLTFPEMNLRTYVVGPSGPGIWFFSLDAASLFAVLGARTTFGLPYFWAKMVVRINPSENFTTIPTRCFLNSSFSSLRDVWTPVDHCSSPALPLGIESCPHHSI